MNMLLYLGADDDLLSIISYPDINKLFYVDRINLNIPVRQFLGFLFLTVLLLMRFRVITSICVRRFLNELLYLLFVIREIQD